MMRKVTYVFGLFVTTAFLAIGMSSCGNQSEQTKEEAVEVAVESDVAAKCGEGKCGEGKCGGADEAGEKQDHFASIDTDGDGIISKEEFTAHMDNEFAEKDSDGDGNITADDCKMFDKFNANGDEFVSKEEFSAGHGAMFGKIDADGNGSISKDEMKAFAASMETATEEAKCGEGKCGSK